MTVLDSSALIKWLGNVDHVVEYVENRPPPLLTSTICVFEVIDGELGRDPTDVMEVRQRFGGVRALALDETLALEAARMQDRLMEDGERMAARDLLISATARSTGSELVVADSDFQTDLLEDIIDVTNLAR